MSLHTSTGKAVGADADRLTRTKQCIPCLLNIMYSQGYRNECWCDENPEFIRKASRFIPTGMPVERHHTLSGGIRRGHAFTFGNCLWHHRALMLPGFVTSSMTARYGPSLAKGSKPFRQVYGSDDSMIEMQTAILYEMPRYVLIDE